MDQRKEQDFEIEITSHDERTEGGLQLPMNFIVIGDQRPDDIQIYIKSEVYKSIESFASSDTSRELGCILIGNNYSDGIKNYVVISGFIEAKYTDASASSLTFTHNSWEYIHAEHARSYPSKKIVGWQHTHPGFGVFLSSFDLFIQENFFNLPWQIAYVVDPIKNERGLFQWRNNTVQKVSAFFIYDDPGKEIDVEINRKGSNEVKQRFRCFDIAIGAAVIILFSMQLITWGNNQSLNKKLEFVRDEFEVIENQHLAGIDQINQKIAEFESHLYVVKPVPANLNLYDNYLVFIKHTVQPGDNINNICEKYGVLYRDFKQLIIRINGIDNENVIFPGQTLLIPININNLYAD